MSRNSRGSFQEQPIARPSKSSNINIQINFNMKDKNHALVGRKLQNLVEIQHRERDKNVGKKVEELKKYTKQKKNTQNSADLDQKKDIKVDQHQKKRKNNFKEKEENHENTPEKKSNSKKEQRSKSTTNNKKMKKKLAKSMQNIRACMKQPIQIRQKSNSNSPDKSRSQSQSSKKLLKKNKESLRNLFGFTNSNIKSKLTKNSKVNLSKDRASSSHLNNLKSKEEDNDKIRKFMEEKKKKDRREKQKNLREEKIKKQKIYEELRKVEVERKANASKPFHLPKKQIMDKNERVPIYFGEDDDQFDQQKQYNNLKAEAGELIHNPNFMNSSPIKEIRTVSISNQSSKKKKKRSAQKHQLSHEKDHSRELIARYLINVQSNIRGFLSRNRFIKLLKKEESKFQEKKKLILQNKKQYWGEIDRKIQSHQKNKYQQIDEEGILSDNSIIFVKERLIKIEESQKPKIIKNIWSKEERIYISQENVEEEAKIEIKPIKFLNKKLELQIEEQQIPSQKGIEMEKQKEFMMKGANHAKFNTFQTENHYELIHPNQKFNSNPITASYDSKLMEELQLLKKQLLEQNQKSKLLEEENQILKNNLAKKSYENSQKKSIEGLEIKNDSIQFFEIRMPKKIEENQLTPSNNSSSKKNQKEVYRRQQYMFSEEIKKPIHNLTLEQLHSDTISGVTAQKMIKDYKKQFESYECSPSNAQALQKRKEMTFKSISPQRLKKHSLEDIFKKKQSKMEQSYEKKQNIVQKMLTDKLFSPRTYNFKKKELENKLQEEKEIILVRYEEAKRVVGFIEDVVIEDDSNQEGGYFINQNEEVDSKASNQSNNIQQKALEEHHKQKALEEHHNKLTKKQSFPSDKRHQLEQQQHNPMIAHISEKKSLNIKYTKNKSNNINNCSLDSEPVSQTSERLYNNYWKDDFQDVHRKTLEITQKIDQALKVESSSEEYSSLNDSHQNAKNKNHQQYSSNSSQYHSLNSNLQDKYEAEETHFGKKQENFPKNKIHESQDNQEQENVNRKYENVENKTKLQEIYHKINSQSYEEQQNDEESINKTKLEQGKSIKRSEIKDVILIDNTSNSSSQLNDSSNNLFMSEHINSSDKIDVPLNGDKIDVPLNVGKDIKKPSQRKSQDNNLQHENNDVQHLSEEQDLYEEYPIQELPQEDNNQGSHRSKKSQSMSNVMLEQVNKLSGFQTSLTFLKQYCISICQYIRSSSTTKQTFLQKISSMLTINLHQYLKSYRTTLSNQNNSLYNSYAKQYLYPFYKIIESREICLTHQLIQDFKQFYQIQNYHNAKWIVRSKESQQVVRSKKSQQVVRSKESQQVVRSKESQSEQKMSENNSSGGGSVELTILLREYFLISIIDALNQSLDYERPASNYGKCVPWMNNSKCLKNYQNKDLSGKHEAKQKEDQKIHNFEDLDESLNMRSEDGELTKQQQKLDQIFGVAIAKLIQWGSCLCGFIPDPMPLQMSQSQQSVNITPQQVNQIRETRMALMLQKWLIEQQEMMIHFQPEFTEVMLSIAEKIVEQLMKEGVEDVKLVLAVPL